MICIFKFTHFQFINQLLLLLILNNQIIVFGMQVPRVVAWGGCIPVWAIPCIWLLIVGYYYHIWILRSLIIYLWNLNRGLSLIVWTFHNSTIFFVLVGLIHFWEMSTLRNLLTGVILVKVGWKVMTDLWVMLLDDTIYHWEWSWQ